MGGYKRVEVRTFLNDVADDLEELLQARQDLNERLIALEGRLAEYRQSEDDLRRAVVSAERIAQELRENARREAELITAQAEAYRDGVTQQANARSVALESRHEARTGELETLHRARSTELEAAHQARSTQLEASYRARFADLEAQFHRRHRELEQGVSARTTHMESAFSTRHNELSTLLSRARDEQAQFVAQYRALVGSFYELSNRHPLPEPAPLPTELPPTIDVQQRPSPARSALPAGSDPGELPYNELLPVSGATPALGETPPSAPEHAEGSTTVTDTPSQIEEQQFV